MSVVLNTSKNWVVPAGTLCHSNGGLILIVNGNIKQWCVERYVEKVCLSALKG